MIDLHCHILPGIDDGPKTLEESLEMAQAAVDHGITHILCTPHHSNGTYHNPANKVIPAVKAFQDELDQRNIPLMLFEGQEVHLTGDLLKQIDRGEILFADLDNRYILIELPTSGIPLYTEDMFYRLLVWGRVPIIVHPERNAAVRRDPNIILPFLEMGCLTQLTAPSLVGFFGKDIQKTALKMLYSGMLHMVASDAHNLRKRKFYLEDAFYEINKRLGLQAVSDMDFRARAVLNGDDIVIPEFKEVLPDSFRLW